MGNYEWEYRGELCNHKKDANIISIYTEKLLTYMQNRIADCLAFDMCTIWTLDFTENSCLKISTSHL